LLNLAKHLKWPICADLLSQIRCQQKTDELFVNFDWAIQSKIAPSPDIILHFGGSFISKAILEWTKQLQVTILHVHSNLERIDPLHCRPIRIHADPALFCRSLTIPAVQDDSWLKECKIVDTIIEQKLSNQFSIPHPFTEADMMRRLGKELPKNWSLFLSNSMPIRDADRFFFPNTPKFIFANRGLAGIDGQIATAAGIADALKTPLLAIIGDQSCLYDLNSISLLRRIDSPLLLLISNNFGGGIFSHLPVARELDHFESLFGASHTWRFDRIAQMFDIPYQNIASSDLNGIFNISKAFILEINNSRQDNRDFQKKLIYPQNAL